MRIAWTAPRDADGQFPVHVSTVTSFSDPHPGAAELGLDPVHGCETDRVLEVPATLTDDEMAAIHRLWELTLGEQLVTVDAPVGHAAVLDLSDPLPPRRLAEDNGEELYAGNIDSMADVVDWFRATRGNPWG